MRTNALQKWQNDPKIAYLLDVDAENHTPYGWAIKQGYSPAEVGPGWGKLLLKAAYQIAEIDTKKEFRIAQIKEKFAGLVIYLQKDGKSPIVLSIIGVGDYVKNPDESRELWSKAHTITSDIREESEGVCEMCGLRIGAKPRGRYWIKTYCIFHHWWFHTILESKVISKINSKIIDYRWKKRNTPR